MKMLNLNLVNKSVKVCCRCYSNICHAEKFSNRTS